MENKLREIIKFAHQVYIFGFGLLLLNIVDFVDSVSQIESCKVLAEVSRFDLSVIE